MMRINMLAAMDDWPVDSQYSRGHLVRIIGPAGGPEVGTECLLFERGITYYKDA